MSGSRGGPTDRLSGRGSGFDGGGDGSAGALGFGGFDLWGLLGGVLLLAAGIAAFCNSLAGAFVFDDRQSLVDNPTIRHLWPPDYLWAAPKEAGVGGRPVASLSYALDYAAGGGGVFAYHLTNLAVHLVAGLFLFGLARRVFRSPVLRERFGGAATGLGLAVGVLWTVHPVQTATVSYMSQRTEELMGLFYLGALYFFVRGVEAEGKRSAGGKRAGAGGDARGGVWFFLAASACALGMASKEVMASAPVMVLLCDRTFFAGSFGEALRKRGRWHAANAATWLILAFLVLHAPLGQRGVGYAGGVSAVRYSLTECRALVRYLDRAVWPHPLIFDYGWDFVTGPGQALPYALVLAVLGAGFAWALVRRPPIGFLGFWFFGIIAPSSSVIPVFEQPMAESRLYLSAAAVVAAEVAAIYLAAEWVARRAAARRSDGRAPGEAGPEGAKESNRPAGAVACGAAAVIGVVFIGLAVRRNEDYRTEVALWTDTVAKRPDNPRAHDSLGTALFAEGMRDAAAGEQEEAGRLEEAGLGQLRRSVTLKPDYGRSWNNLGNAYATLGRLADAQPCYERSLRIKPDNDMAEANLGNVLVELGHRREGIAHYEKAVAMNPDSPVTLTNLAIALMQEPGGRDEAITRWGQVLRLTPEDAAAHCSLGIALAQEGRASEARGEFEEALRLKPDLKQARQCLDELAASGGR